MEPLAHLRPLSEIVEGSQAASFNGFGQGERVSAEEVDVLVAEWGQAGHVLLMQGVILQAELLKDGLDVNRVPEDDDVGDQP